jgi:hypothetical protein
MKELANVFFFLYVYALITGEYSRFVESNTFNHCILQMISKAVRVRVRVCFRRNGNTPFYLNVQLFFVTMKERQIMHQ